MAKNAKKIPKRGAIIAKGGEKKRKSGQKWPFEAKEGKKQLKRANSGQEWAKPPKAAKRGGKASCGLYVQHKFNNQHNTRPARTAHLVNAGGFVGRGAGDIGGAHQPSPTERPKDVLQRRRILFVSADVGHIIMYTIYIICSVYV